MDDNNLVRYLTESFVLQVGLYKKLAAVVQKILSQLVLSRGNLAAVMGLFEEKQGLMNTISGERDRVAHSVQAWQERKSVIPSSDATARLDAVLVETENVIKSFLDAEAQLEQYLKHLVAKENRPSP
jgi:hypothetical protein